MTNTLTCPRCGASGVPQLRWQPTTSPAITHLRATCSICSSFVKFVPQRDEWTTLVAAQERAGAGS